MDGMHVQFVSVALGATWAGLGAWALVRSAARSPRLRALSGRLRRARPAVKAGVAAAAIAVVAAGGTKPGDGGGGGGGGLRSGGAAAAETFPFALVEAATNGVALRAPGAEAVFDESWPLHGSSDGGFWIEAEAPFFRVGTNPVSRAYVSAGGTVSFGSTRRPAVGAALPDGALPPVLAPLRAALGMVPDAAEPDADARSRFWHEETPGGGRRLTWENDRAGRLPGRRVSFQVDLERNGDFVFRYDFKDALDPPAADFAIGAQAGTNAVTALAVLGTNAPAGASVRRADGAARPAPVPLADLLCTNGILRTPARFALEWKNVSAFPDPLADTDGDNLSDGDELFVHGTDPALADTDGDGLPDGAEILAGADPLDPDEDDDGIPDGSTRAAWEANPLWATNAVGGANVAVTLAEDVEEGDAVLQVGSLAIPLSTARTWELRIPEGPGTEFSLRTTRGAAVALVLSPPAGGRIDPIRVVDPDGVFSVEVPDPDPPLRGGRAPGPVRRKARGGNGEIHVFECRFVDAATRVPAPENECIHDAAGERIYRVEVSNPLDEGAEPAWSSPVPAVRGIYPLYVSDEPGDTATATALFLPPFLAWGEESLTVTIHRCIAGAGIEYCAACDLWHDDGYDDDPDPCLHDPDCPKKTDPDAACDCDDLVVRVDDETCVQAISHVLPVPEGRRCCCEEDSDDPYVRLLQVPPFLVVSNETGRLFAGDAVFGGASVVAAERGGPGVLSFRTVHRYPGGAGATVTRTTERTVWAVELRMEPITTAMGSTNGAIANPCCVVSGETAWFGLTLFPLTFPDERIVWTSTGPGEIEFVGGNTGRRVQVRGGARLGDVTVRASILGYRGPQPEVRTRVVARTHVPVRAWIVHGGFDPETGEEWLPKTEPEVWAMFPEVNRIYDQVGISFELSDVTTITNADWAHIADTNAAGSRFEDLCSYGRCANGLELYCVWWIDGAVGMTSRAGAVVRRDATANTVAHEFGHSCGLPDVYNALTNLPDLVVTGSVRREWTPGDWGAGAADENYYPPGLTQSNLLCRLLMYGRERNEGRRDITVGDVHGLWNVRDFFGPTGNFAIGTVPVGFHAHGNRQPVSQ